VKEETVERLRVMMSNLREGARDCRCNAKKQKAGYLLAISDRMCLDANAILEALEALGVSGLPKKLMLKEVVWKTK